MADGDGTCTADGYGACMADAMAGFARVLTRRRGGQSLPTLVLFYNSSYTSSAIRWQVKTTALMLAYLVPRSPRVCTHSRHLGTVARASGVSCSAR